MGKSKEISQDFRKTIVDLHKFATAHGDKDHTFWRNVLWSDEAKIELLGHNDHHYVWRKKGEGLQAEEHHPNREAQGW